MSGDKSSTEKPKDTGFNFGVQIVTVITASLGFVLSLALNDAFKLSFDAMLSPGTVGSKALGASWSYAMAALVFVLTLLFVLLSCLQPKLAEKPSTKCKGKAAWAVPLGGGLLLALIIILSATIPSNKNKQVQEDEQDNEP